MAEVTFTGGDEGRLAAVGMRPALAGVGLVLVPDFQPQRIRAS